MNLAHKGVRSSARRQQNLDMQQTYPGPKPLQVSFRQNLKYTYMRLNFTMVFTPFHSGNTIFDILKPLKNFPSRPKSGDSSHRLVMEMLLCVFFTIEKNDIHRFNLHILPDVFSDIRF